MTKENKKLLLGFIIVLLIAGLYLTIHSLFIAKSPIDKLFGQKVTLVEEKLEPDYADEVKEKYQVKSVFGKDLGYVYEVGKINSYGYIVLYVGVKGRLIYAIDKEIVQTENMPYSKNYLMDRYWGVTRDQVSNMDGSTGATTVSQSRKTMDELIKIAADAHFGPDTPDLPSYEAFFGPEYEITDTNSNPSSDVVTKIETIGDKGFVYTAEKSGLGYADGGVAKIEIRLMLDPTGKILGYQFGQYDHSGGGFQTNVENYLEALFTDKNIKDIPDDLTGGTTSDNASGNSTRLVVQIIHAIKEVFESETTK